jgi:hypothetical protein
LFGDFVELLLLFLVLGEDGVDVAVFGIAVVGGRASGFGLFVFLRGFLFLLLGDASLVMALSIDYTSSGSGRVVFNLYFLTSEREACQRNLSCGVSVVGVTIRDVEAAFEDGAEP